MSSIAVGPSKSITVHPVPARARPSRSAGTAAARVPLALTLGIWPCLAALAMWSPTLLAFGAGVVVIALVYVASLCGYELTTTRQERQSQGIEPRSTPRVGARFHPAV